MISCRCGCVPRLGRRALIATGIAGGLALTSSRAQAEVPRADGALIDDLATANRILYDQGVVDGFGHISARHDKDPNLYLLSRSMAPGLVTSDDIMTFDLDSNPAGGDGRAPYLERFIHGEIYRVRPDVKAIVHSHSPGVLPFADTKVALKPMNHIAGFLGAGPPVFDIRSAGGAATDMLIRDNALGKALAHAMGSAQILLMRGHGSVAAAQSIRHVVFRAIYTEVNARTEIQALAIGKPEFLNTREAHAAMETNDKLVDRPWALWKQRANAK